MDGATAVSKKRERSSSIAEENTIRRPPPPSATAGAAEASPFPSPPAFADASPAAALKPPYSHFSIELTWETSALDHPAIEAHEKYRLRRGSSEAVQMLLDSSPGTGVALGRDLGGWRTEALNLATSSMYPDKVLSQETAKNLPVQEVAEMTVVLFGMRLELHTPSHHKCEIHGHLPQLPGQPPLPRCAMAFPKGIRATLNRTSRSTGLDVEEELTAAHLTGSCWQLADPNFWTQCTITIGPIPLFFESFSASLETSSHSARKLKPVEAEAEAQAQAQALAASASSGKGHSKGQGCCERKATALEALRWLDESSKITETPRKGNSFRNDLLREHKSVPARCAATGTVGNDSLEAGHILDFSNGAAVFDAIAEAFFSLRSTQKMYGRSLPRCLPLFSPEHFMPSGGYDDPKVNGVVLERAVQYARSKRGVVWILNGVVHAMGISGEHVRGTCYRPMCPSYGVIEANMSAEQAKLAENHLQVQMAAMEFRPNCKVVEVHKYAALHIQTSLSFWKLFMRHKPLDTLLAVASRLALLFLRDLGFGGGVSSSAGEGSGASGLGVCDQARPSSISPSRSDCLFLSKVQSTSSLSSSSSSSTMTHDDEEEPEEWHGKDEYDEEERKEMEEKKFLFNMARVVLAHSLVSPLPDS